MSSPVAELSSNAPARLPTARSGPFYGAVLLCAVMSVVTGALLFSYGFLAANSDVWRDGRPGPPVWGFAAAAALAVVAAVATTLAQRAVDHHSPAGPAVRGLLVAGVACAAAAAAVWWTLADLPYAADEDSFTAVTFLLSWFAALLLVAGGVAALVTTTWLIRGHEGEVSALEAVRIVRVLMCFLALVTPVVLGTVGFGGGWG